MAKITDTELKELQRLRSMDEHVMTFFWRGLGFRYIETGAGCEVRILSDHDLQVVALDKRLGHDAFETWCICWNADHGEAV